MKLALQDLPKGSGALKIAYAEALERIKGQRSRFQRLAEAVLSWIVCARRQLTISELRHALAVEDGASEIAEDNLPEADEMVSVCAGMVTVDEESGIIRLVHFTMQEYFESTLQTWAPLAQAAIAKTCLTYLSFDVFETGPCDSAKDLQQRCQRNLLFDYAARYWGIHVESTAEEEVEHMALDFLDNERNILSSYQILDHQFITREIKRQVRGHELSNSALHLTAGFKAIHLIAYLGLGRLLLAFLRRGQYVNFNDSRGRTPLSFAAKNGHEAVVRVLLDQASVEADCKDAVGRTLLSYVSASGHVEIAKLLIKRSDVNINSTDQKTCTPLLRAVSAGQETIVMLLLERDDIQIHLRGKAQSTPLMVAARMGHENIARLLLQKDGHQMYTGDVHGNMALHLAAACGHDKIVMLLLESDENRLNAKDLRGRTALINAVRHGNLATVELLLERKGICINEVDEPDQLTALMHAASCGHETIVRQLLKRDEIQVNKRSHCNWTALEIAAMRGHESVVKLLLSRKEVDLNMEAETLENSCESMIKLIGLAKDRKYGGPSWRDEPYEVPCEKADE